MRLCFVACLLLTLTGCISVSDNQQTEFKPNPVDMSESRIALGLGYLDQGNMPRARENLEQALKHAPDYYRAQLSMAYYYEAVGEAESAAAQYRQALKQHPHNGNVLNNYGTFLCKHGKYNLADIYFNKAIHQPDYYQVASSYENAAFCSLKSGDKAQAKNYFQQAVDHNPNRIRALFQLTQLDIDQKDYTNARQRLLQFQEKWGVHRASLEMLIKVEEKAGNTQMKNSYQNQLLALSH